MFGLTIEKLFVIAVVAAFVIGPQRLPAYASALAGFVRSFRAFLESTRARTEEELGLPLDAARWQAQARRYDPRRIVRDALADTEEPPAGPPPPAVDTGSGRRRE